MVIVPSAFHPPHRKCVAEPVVGWKLPRSQLLLLAVRPGQDLVQEHDVSAGQLQRLDLGELVAGQGRNDLPQTGEGFVQALRTLSLPDISRDPLGLHVLERLQIAPLPLAAPVALVVIVRSSVAPLPLRLGEISRRLILIILFFRPLFDRMVFYFHLHDRINLGCVRFLQAQGHQGRRAGHRRVAQVSQIRRGRAPHDCVVVEPLPRLQWKWKWKMLGTAARPHAKAGKRRLDMNGNWSSRGISVDWMRRVAKPRLSPGRHASG